MIDAHHHLWEYNPDDYVWMTSDMERLRRDFLLRDLRPLMEANGVVGLVTVQARQTIRETEWLLDLADEYDEIRGVVGWVSLMDEDAGETLERFCSHPKLRGVRHVVHDEPDDDFILRADFNRGVRLLQKLGLAYDLLIFERHLPQTVRFVRMHPGQVFVLDHIAKPRIRERLISPWREHIRELAAFPNVYCKLSGVVTEANWETWTDADLAPYFDIVLDAFGPKRLMFGSDWPVLTLASTYTRWVRTLNGAILSLSQEEQSWIKHRTAIEAYRLEIAGGRGAA